MFVLLLQPVPAVDVAIVEVCVEYFNNFHNVCIISYQNVSAGISSHLYTAIESAVNDKVCILHIHINILCTLYLCQKWLSHFTKKMRFIVLSL